MEKLMPIKLMLDTQTHKKLKALAKENGRTMQKQAVHSLREYISKQQGIDNDQ